MSEIIREEINVLKQIIIDAQRHYYQSDQPIMSDYDFDIKFRQLQKLEEAHPEFITFDSPTQIVGY